MNKFIPSYRPFGQPATAWLRFAQAPLPAVGEKITIGGVDYVMGTDFNGANASACAVSLCDTINAVPGTCNSAKGLLPIKAFYALFYGNHVALVATNPRVAGASLGLTTDSDSITLSGATFSGGADTIDLVP